MVSERSVCCRRGNSLQRSPLVTVADRFFACGRRKRLTTRNKSQCILLVAHFPMFSLVPSIPCFFSTAQVLLARVGDIYIISWLTLRSFMLNALRLETFWLRVSSYETTPYWTDIDSAEPHQRSVASSVLRIKATKNFIISSKLSARISTRTSVR